ncbi:hypothetical protein D3C86_2257740 [compost metagenome]
MVVGQQLTESDVIQLIRFQQRQSLPQYIAVADRTGKQKHFILREQVPVGFDIII